MRELPPIGTAWVAERVLDFLVGDAERMHPLESGGVLIGYWVQAEKEVVITDATGPGPRAIHDEDKCLPDDVYDAHEIAVRYEASGHLHTYLGDWHSHPQSGPSLSPRDQRTLRAIALQQAAVALVPLMAIIGQWDQESVSWGLMVWRFVPPRSQAKKLGLWAVPLRIQRY